MKEVAADERWLEDGGIPLLPERATKKAKSSERVMKEVAADVRRLEDGGIPLLPERAAKKAKSSERATKKAESSERATRESGYEEDSMGAILTINSGSSSLKFGLYRAVRREPELLVKGMVENIGRIGGRLSLKDSEGEILIDRAVRTRDVRDALEFALDALEEFGLPRPAAAGHRLVHGGPDHVAHIRIDRRVRAQLKKAILYAPLHLPAELAAVDLVAARYRGVTQVACFDTAFHAGMPARAQRIPLPTSVLGRGVRRYGFHGLSYEYLVSVHGSRELGRAVLAHLGNGASLAAVDHGHSVDTTMGFTPAGGVIMSTRPGDLDPGVLLYLQQHRKISGRSLERVINRESGLAAISSRGGDMRRLVELRRKDADARLAVEMFCDRVRKTVGAFAATLGGLNTLVFTGGIGEHQPVIRKEICDGLEHLGVRIDPAKNRASAGVVSKRGSECVVRVTPTDEDLMIARHTARLVGLG